MTRIFKLCLKGTRDMTVERGRDYREACWSAGYDPDKCEAVDITDDLERASEDGMIYEVRIPQDRRRQIEEMFRQIGRKEILKRLSK